MNDKETDNINLEELRGRSDIALISDDVGSGEELVNQFMKYLMLSRKRRRYSDYYSVKLFGSNVSDMFVTMLYRFKPESPIPMNETLFVSEPDLYYNKTAFDEGRINLCFVIGYSGSGKSVLTQEYEGDNVEKISMDDLVCARDHFSLKQLKNMSELLYAFFSGDGSKYYITREERALFADHSEVFVKFIEYAIEYAKSHMDTKYILEGIWTYLFFDDPSKFDDYAVFMKGTSLIKSKFRRLLRESGNNPQESLERLLDFGIYAGDTTLRDSNVDKWRRHFEKKPETVFKLENNKFTILAETIMEQINSINECFVHGDADGIKLIMENASSNSEMDITEQLIVIEECKRALADLK
jgi:hypothetical protein